MRCDVTAALAADQDVQAYTERPLTDDENALAEIADWGPAEDWADWADAARWCGLPPHLVVTDQYLSLPEIRWQTASARSLWWP